MRSRVYLGHALWLFAIWGFHFFMAFEKNDFDNLWRISVMMLEFAIIYLHCSMKLQRWEK